MVSFVPLLSDDEIVQICRGLGHRWRRRLFTPPVTVRSLLYRALHPDKSILNAVEELVGCESLLEHSSVTPGAWCQARDRLPNEVLPILFRRTTERARKHFEHRSLWFGRPAYIVDGTTVSMPDEPALVKTFGRSMSKHGSSRFPLARLVAILQAGLNIVSDYRLTPCKVGEQPLFHQMLPGIPRGAVVITDRHYCGYVNFVLARRYRLDLVSRLHQRRDPHRLIQQGKPIGGNEWLVRLQLNNPHRRAHLGLNLPCSIRLRLIRYTYHFRKKKQVLYILTTLLDMKAYPRKAIVALYRKRWGIETHYNHLKTTLAMAVLRSKNPRNIRIEMLAIMLAHNLVWTLIHEAAQRSSRKPERISFAGAVKVILAFCAPLRMLHLRKRRKLYRQMLREIARQRNRYRPNRHEPRLVKRDCNLYPMLRTSREKARKCA
jgi:hypothetical protein